MVLKTRVLFKRVCKLAIMNFCRKQKEYGGDFARLIAMHSFVGGIPAGTNSIALKIREARFQPISHSLKSL